MKKFFLITLLFLAVPAAAFAQTGQYLGNLSSNPFDPNSTSNQFGAGNPTNPNSINNQFGVYGNPFRPDSPNNPYGSGLSIFGE